MSTHGFLVIRETHYIRMTNNSMTSKDAHIFFGYFYISQKLIYYKIMSTHAFLVIKRGQKMNYFQFQHHI